MTGTEEGIERIFCRLCGQPMRAASLCPKCGWADRLGWLAEVTRREALERARRGGAAPSSPSTSASAGSASPEASLFRRAPPPPGSNPPTGLGASVVEPVPSRGIQRPTEPSTAVRTMSSSVAPPSPRPAAGRGSPPSAPPSARPAAAARPPPSPPSRFAKLKRSKPVVLVKRWFPPVRLVWLFLLVIVWNGHGFLNMATAKPLLFVPVVALAVDLGFQAVRFPKLRVPDAAIANGLFLTVILWPSQISLALVAVVIVTVGLRHAVRVASHPIFNPAAAGVLVAATVFALPQPWHVGTTLSDTLLVGALGLILWSRAWPTWRLWGSYFLANLVAAVVVADLLAGTRALPFVLQTTVFGATPVFFGLFMVTEPRTAPTARPAMLVFGSIVGVAAIAFPALLGQDPTISALGVLAPYLALFAGNAITVAWASSRGVRAVPKPNASAASKRPVPSGGDPS